MSQHRQHAHAHCQPYHAVAGRRHPSSSLLAHRHSLPIADLLHNAPLTCCCTLCCLLLRLPRCLRCNIPLWWEVCGLLPLLAAVHQQPKGDASTAAPVASQREQRLGASVPASARRGRGGGGGGGGGGAGVAWYELSRCETCQEASV